MAWIDEKLAIRLNDSLNNGSIIDSAEVMVCGFSVQQRAMCTLFDTYNVQHLHAFRLAKSWLARCSPEKKLFIWYVTHMSTISNHLISEFRTQRNAFRSRFFGQSLMLPLKLLDFVFDIAEQMDSFTMPLCAEISIFGVPSLGFALSL